MAGQRGEGVENAEDTHGSHATLLLDLHYVPAGKKIPRLVSKQTCQPLGARRLSRSRPAVSARTRGRGPSAGGTVGRSGGNNWRTKGKTGSRSNSVMSLGDDQSAARSWTSSVGDKEAMKCTICYTPFYFRHSRA